MLFRCDLGIIQARDHSQITGTLIVAEDYKKGRWNLGCDIHIDVTSQALKATLNLFFLAVQK